MIVLKKKASSTFNRASHYLNLKIPGPIKKGKIEKLKSIFDQATTDINEETLSSCVGLHTAAEYNQIAAAQYLLDKGISPNLYIHGKSPLHVAAENGDYDFVKFLYDNGACIYCEHFSILYCQAVYGKNPLYYAMENNQQEMIQFLVKKMKKSDHYKLCIKRMILTAFENGDKEVIQEIISLGNNIEQDDLIRFPLSQKNEDFLLWLITQQEIQLDNLLIEILLFKSILESCNKLTKYLLNFELKNNLQQLFGSSYLYFAVINNNLEIAKFLVERGEDINFIADDGSTLLHASVISGNILMIKYFLELGLDAHAQNAMGKTLLHLVHNIKDYPTKIIKLLLDHGIKINSTDFEGKTPLHDAITEDSFFVATQLISSGANVNAKDIGRKTPLYYAHKNENHAAINLLVEHGANLSTMLAETEELHIDFPNNVFCMKTLEGRCSFDLNSLSC